MIDYVSLTPRQRQDLRTISAMIIPASEEYRVPGADEGLHALGKPHRLAGVPAPVLRRDQVVA